MPGEQIENLDLSRRLKEVMLHHDLTVSDLAKIAHVSKSAMEKYLAGPSSPRAVALANICMALELSPTWLLFGEADQDEHLEFVAFTVAVHAEFGKALKDLRGDQDLMKTFVEAEPGDEIWQDRFARDFAYVRAKAAYRQFLHYRGSSVVGPTMPILGDGKDSRKP